MKDSKLTTTLYYNTVKGFANLINRISGNRKRQQLIPSPHSINYNNIQIITNKKGNMTSNCSATTPSFAKFIFGFFTILCLFSASLNVNGQAALYTATTGTNASLALDKSGNAIDMSTGTTQLYGASVDAYTATVTNIGFGFNLLGNGTVYHQFSCNPDGQIRLGSTAITGQTQTAASGVAFLIANNLNGITDATGKVHYKLQGTAPNRVLIVEWNNVQLFNANSTTNLSTYQTRIYEDGTVEYVYGRMFNNATGTNNAQNIAISTSNTAGTIGQFETLNGTPAYNSARTSFNVTNFANGVDMTNLNSTADGSRRFFRFVPSTTGCPTAPTAQPTAIVVNPTSNTFNSISGSFTAAAVTPAPTGYLVLRTTQNIAPTLTTGENYGAGYVFGSTPEATVVSTSASTSFTATGLASGRTYYFWVYAYNGPTVAAPCGTVAYNTTSPLSGTTVTNVQILPTCVTSTTPINNFNGFSPVDTLRWSAVTALPAITKYLLYLSKTQALVDNNSSTVLTDVGNVLLRQPGTLDFSSTYYWKVRAVSGTDTALACETRSFTTAGPSVPLCYQGSVTPTSGATGVSTTANIVWGTAVGAPSPTGYDIYISTNSAAVQGLQLSARIISGTTTTNFTPGITTIVLNPGTQYFWTVVPTNYLGGASGCTVYSFTTYAPGKVTSTTRGGLWSDVNTWVGGVVPAANDSVIINDGAVVYASSAPNLVRNLIIGQNGANTAVLQLGAALTVSGNITINSNGRLLPFNTTGTGQTINVGGNFTNNGYTNLALASTQLNFNGSQIGGGSTAQVLGGTGTFEGDTTGTGNGSVIGVIRDLRFQTTGSSVINTTQNLAVNGSLYHTAGSLNTNGKLMIDNSKQLYGRDINNQVTALAVTAHGTAAYSVATPPVVGPSGALYWVASSTGGATAYAANQIRVTSTNMYLVTAGSGNSGSSTPTGTSTSAITDGGWTLYWVGATGTIGSPYNPNTTRTVGAQYFYGNKLFTLYKINTASPLAANYATLFGVLAGATNIGDRVGSTLGDSLVFVGSPATATVNLLETPAASGTGSVRSLNLTSGGSGYYTTAPTLSVVNMTSATVTAPTVAATFIQSSAGATNTVFFKEPNASITGGLTILSDLQVRGVSATAGGINYGGTPRVGFPLPTNFHNLVTRSGSGYTANPTTAIRIYGGTTLANFTNPTFNFNVAQGRLVSAICTAGGTGWLTQPDSIRVAPTTGTDSATIRFPANSLARAIALMRARSVVGFRVTNPGDGYASAPTPTLDSTGNNGQAFTAATAAGITSRVGLYNLTYQVLNPTLSVNEGTTSVEIPSNKQINVLTINTKAKVKYAASSDTLKIIGGAGALSLSAATSNPSGVNQYGTTLDMNGGLLFFYSPLYAGFGSVTNYGQQDAYGHVKNGSMRIALPGTVATTTGATRIFPFRSPVSLFTGTRTANGSDGPSMGYVTVSESGVPSTTNPASKVPVGKKSYNVKAEPFISNASVLYGVNPIFTMVYGASDSLPGSLTNANLSIGQSSSASGTWVDRGKTSGAYASLQSNTASTDFITPQQSVSTATTVNGPFVTNSGNDFFALLNIASNPTVTAIAPSVFCSAGGESVTLTGTGFSGTTQVLFNGLAAASFSVVSNTSITAVTPNGISAGNVTVISNGLTGISSSTYSVRNVGTFAPVVNPSNGLICTATDKVTISLNDINAESYSWSPSTGLDVAQGLSVVATPTTSTTYTVSAVFSASGSNPACTVTAKFVVGPIASTPIVPSASPAVSCFNTGQTVTLNSNLSAGNFTVSNIPYAYTTAPSNATVLAERGSVPAGVNYQCAYCPLDDAGFPNIPIGFNFNFFGNFFDKLSAGTNGLLAFGQVPSYAANAGINQYSFNNTPVTFPNGENPGNVIAAGIGDLGAQTATQSLTCTLTSGSTTVTTANGYIFNIGDSLVGTGIPAGTFVTGVVSSNSATATGSTTFTMSNAATSSGPVSVSFQIKPSMRYWTEGSAPTRRFVFEYKSVGGSNGTNTANSGTVQVMLYETTGIVEMHIQKINNTIARTYGLQDVTKQIGAVAPGRQAYGSGTFVPEAWRFAPPTNYSFLWSPSSGLDNTTQNSAIFTVASPGEKSVNLKVTNPVTGCVTNKVVPFTVNVTPTAPTVSGVTSVCGSGITALNSNYPSAGNVIRWYNAPVGGSLLTTSTLYVTPVVTSTTTYYVEQATSRTLNPCSSPRTPVVVSITAPPSFAVNKPVLCATQTSSKLEVTTNTGSYDTYVWSPVTDLYEDSALTIPYSGRSLSTVYAGSLIPGYKKYICSASNFESLCATKDSSEIVVQPSTGTITASPAVICISGTSELSFNTSTDPYAGTIQWQLSLNGTTYNDIPGATTKTITAPQDLVNTTRYYRVIVKDLNGNACFVSSAYTLQTINPQPTNATAKGFCSASGKAILSAVVPSSGGIIKWYAANGTSLLSTNKNPDTTTTITQSTNYYVSLTQPDGSANGCEGSKTLVTALVSTPAALTLSNNVTVCNNSVATLSVTSDTTQYNSYVWTPVDSLYTDAAATSPYASTTSKTTVYARSTVAGTKSYTVTASNATTGCENNKSVEVTTLPATFSASLTGSPVCKSGTATITVAQPSNPGTAAISWERSSDGTNFTSISNASSFSYTTTTLTQQNYYRATIKDASSSSNVCAVVPATVQYSNPSISADSVVGDERCGAGTVTLTVKNPGGTVKWYADSTTTSVLRTTTTTAISTYSPQPNSTRKYFVSLTLNGCEGSARTAVPVTIGTSPDLTLSSTSQTVNCDNPIVALSVVSTIADYDTYVWTPATNLYIDSLAENAYSPGSSATKVYVKTDTAGVYIYKVSAANSNFCSNIKFDTVTVLAANPITVSPETATLCNNTPQLLSISSGAANYTNYTWTPATNLYTSVNPDTVYDNSQNVSSVYFRSATAGSATYIVYASNPGSACVASDTATLTVMPASGTITTTSGSSPYCKAVVASLKFTPASDLPAGATMQWQWSSDNSNFNDISGATTNSYSVAGTLTRDSSTTYYRMVVKNPSGVVCFVANYTAVVNNPVIVSTQGAQRCGNGSVNLLATASSGATLAWYSSNSSSNPLGTTSSYATPSISSTTDYYVAARIGSCASARVMVTATIAAATTATVSAAQVVCNNTEATVSVTSNTGDYETYFWTTTPASDSTKLFNINGTPYNSTTSATSIYLKTTAVGSTTIKLAADNVTSGCSFNTATTTVAVQPASATSAVNSGATICKSGTATLAVTPSTGYAANTTQWNSSSDNSSFSPIASATSASYTTPTLSTTGISYYNFVVKNGSGQTCFTTNTSSVTVINPLITDTSTVNSRCGTGSVTLTASSSIYPSGTISWYASQNAVSNEALGSSFATPSISANTTFWVAVKIPNGTGSCEGTRTSILAKVTSPDALNVAPTGGIGKYKTVCNNALVELTVTSDTTKYDNYQWSPAADLYTDDQATIPYVAGVSATKVYVKRTATGQIRYFCTASNSVTGCNNQDTSFISIQPASATISGNRICAPVSSSSTMTLVPASGYASNTIQWQVSLNGTSYSDISAATNASYSATNTSTRYYKTIVKDGANATCFTTDAFTLEYSNPSVTLPYTQRSRCGRGTVELKGFASAGDTLKWYSTDLGGTALSAPTDTTFITPIISSQTIYYAAAINKGCESIRLADTAVVSDPPALSITAPQTVCNGVTTLFTVESTVSDYDSYVWSPVTNLFTDAAATVPYVAGQSYTQLYAKSFAPGTTNYEISSNSISRGCSNLSTTSLSVQLQTASISATPSALCVSGTSTLSLSPSSPYGVGSIQWERSVDSITWAPTPGAVGTSYTSPLQTATRFYRASVKNGSGNNCFVTAPYKLVVNTPAVLSTSGSTICGPKSTTITATTTAGSELKWYGSKRAEDVAVLYTGSNYTTPVLSSTTTFYVQASTISSSGCASPRIPVTVTYNQPPAIALSTGSVAYCAGGSSSTVTLTAGQQSYDNISWTPSTDVTGNVENGWVFNPQSSTSYTLVASQSSGNNCSFSIPFAVNVNPLPVIDSVRANLKTSATICNGEIVTLNAYAGGIGSGPQVLPTGYAASAATSASDDEIFNVNIVGTTLNNSSTCTTLAPGPGSITARYSNYTTSVPAATLYAGTPYTGSITIGQCLTTPYATGYAVFIDINRDGDFADAGETVFTAGSSTSNAVAGTVRPFNFNIPTTATPGLTMMRVVAIEFSAAPPATGTYTWGETEDYAVNILSLTTVNPDIVFTWTPGNVTGATRLVTPSDTTTYTVSAVNGITGCAALSTSTVAVNVNQLPTAPEAFNQSQCGFGVPNCYVTGASNGSYRWYLTQTGGTALAGETDNKLNQYTISATDTFYVSIFNGTCESVRSAVIATVSQADQLTASASSLVPCANSAITLSVTQSGTNQNYSYEWTASPVSGSGITTSVSGSSVSVTPTSDQTYVYTVTGTDGTDPATRCVAVNSVTVVVKPNPIVGTATATPATFCAGQSTTLTVNPSLVTGPQFLPTGYLPSNATNSADEDILRVVFGTLDNSSTCSTTGGPGSTLNLYSNYTASVPAPTVTVGDSVTVGFNLGFCGTSTFSNMATMYFDWNRDGDFADAGEAAIGKPYDNTAALTGTYYSGKIKIPNTASPGLTMMRVVLVEASTISPTGTYTYGETEDYAINIIGSSFAGTSYNYSWTPGTLTGASVTATPSVTTAYTARVTNPATGCYTERNVTATVIQLPSAPTVSGNEQCGSGIPDVTATSTTGATNPIFKWYLVATGGTAVQTDTSATTTSTYKSPIFATTTFYVSEISTEGCEGPRTSFTLNVNPPDPILVALSSRKICLGGSTSVTSSYTSDANTFQNFTLTATPSIGSGLSTPASLTIDGTGFGTASYSFTPTEAGTYIIAVTGNDPDKGCNSTGIDTLVVSSLPLIDSVKANVAAICAGGTVNLNAYSSLTALAAAPTTLPTGYCAGGGGTNNADEQIFAVSFGSMINIQTEQCSSNYTDYSGSIAAPSVSRGSTYSFSVTVNECDGPNFSSGVSVFIDYNRDGDFTDAGERVANTTAIAASPYTRTASITIPAGATSGATKMRVVAIENVAIPTPCGTYTYGETEDYAVYITGDVAQTLPVNPNYTYTWNPGASNGAAATVTPTSASSSYTCTVNDPATGCTSVSSPVSITVNAIPSAPVATNSTQCGAGVPSVSVASGDATASPVMNWYNSATPATVVNYYSNNFSTSNYGIASVSGTSSLVNNKLQLTPNSASQQGGLTIPASGVNADRYAVNFKLTTNAAQSGADGLSYSFAPDADATSTTVNAEMGAGTKLKISFDEYGTSGGGAAGIRVIYGSTISDPGTAVGTNGILAYSSNTSWAGVTDVPVVATINAGKLTLNVNGTAVFTDLQLPSSFATDNKSTWKHVFKARSGGVAGIHTIDDVNIQYFNSGLVNTGTTYTEPISNTTTFYVAETSAAGCEGPRSAVVATVNIPDSIAASASSSICLGSSVTLTATTTTGSNNNNYSFAWSSAAGSGLTGSTSGGTGSYGNPASITVTPTATGTYVYTLNATDATGALTCLASSSVTVVVNNLPVLDSAKASASSVCGGAPVTLQAYSGFMDAGPSTQPTGYCTVTNLGTSALSYFDMFSTTGATQNINNSASGYSEAGYGDFGSQIAIASAGQTINFNTTLVGTTVGVAVWVDWNRNGTFETTERVYVTTGFSSTASGSFVVPANATPGATKMRVMIDFNTSVPANPCAISASGRGEVEDYTFRVINGNNIDTALNYTWTPGNITNNTGAVTVNPTTTTTYTVSAVNAASGCAATSTKSVTVNVVPVSVEASSTATGAICVGTAVNLSATPSGVGPFTYSWSNGTSVVSTSASFSATPSATTTYTVTAKDACNNTATSSVTVTVNALPTASINEASPIVICQPNTQELTTSTNATTPVYSWNLNGSTIGGATSSSYTATTNGSYTVSITDQATGCTSATSSAVLVTINQQPTAIVISPSNPSICLGSSGTLSLTGGNIINPNVSSYSEGFNTGASNWTITNAPTSPSATNWSLKTAPFTYTSPGGEGRFTNFSTPNGGKFLLAIPDAGGTGSVTNTVIKSPVFNTTDFTLANLVFEHAYKYDPADVAKVEVSTNGGSSWTTIKTFTQSQGTTANGAQVTKNDTISLASYLNQSNLVVRFNYTSNFGASWWLIDNFRVVGTQAVPTTYAWTPSATLDTSSGSTVVASPTTATTYTVTATSQYGCTRTQTVTVSVNTRPTGVISGDATICRNGSTDVSIDVTGTGPWTGTLSNGASFSGSESPMIVTVSPLSTTVFTIATLSDANCAAVAGDLSGTATITVNQPTSSSISTSVCSNALPYAWNGKTYSVAGTYTYYMEGANANGCDSTAILNLTIKQATTSSTPISNCVSYTWNNVTYTASGTYTKSGLTNAAGCDSTAYLVLTIKQPTTSSTPISSCVSYTWNTVTYTASGTYTKTGLTNAAGCDSTAYLVLTINQPTTSSTPISSCVSYTWNTVTYTASGTYTKTGLTSAAGCDSTAYLVLTINQPSSSDDSLTICSSELPYTWNGVTFTGAGTQTAHITNAAGCDSAATLHLTVNQCFTTLNVKAFIQGFYSGNGTMAATLYDLDSSTDATATDTIEVSLWSTASLTGTTPNYTQKVILHTNGTASVQFPGATLGNSYYVAIKHRNSMETWSASPVTISSTTSYDFSTGLGQAYGDQINDPMKNMGSGVYAMYSGDVNQDGTIDLSDLTLTQNDVSNFAFGYNSSDCSGDGGTDLSDLIIIQNNATLFLFKATPQQ